MAVTKKERFFFKEPFESAFWLYGFGLIARCISSAAAGLCQQDAGQSGRLLFAISDDSDGFGDRCLRFKETAGYAQGLPADALSLPAFASAVFCFDFLLWLASRDSTFDGLCRGNAFGFEYDRIAGKLWDGCYSGGFNGGDLQFGRLVSGALAAKCFLMIEKTNVMRFLDQKKIAYEVYDYRDSGLLAGQDVAAYLNEDPAKAFKTLVLLAASGSHYVFMVPVNAELDLKKAAKAVNEKWVQMVKSRELLALTGYVHGGCSPLGMKKQFKTVIHASFEQLSALYFSAGRIGLQLRVSRADLLKVLPLSVNDIIQS